MSHIQKSVAVEISSPWTAPNLLPAFGQSNIHLTNKKIHRNKYNQHKLIKFYCVYYVLYKITFNRINLNISIGSNRVVWNLLEKPVSQDLLPASISWFCAFSAQMSCAAVQWFDSTKKNKTVRLPSLYILFIINNMISTTWPGNTFMIIVELRLYALLNSLNFTNVYSCVFYVCMCECAVQCTWSFQVYTMCIVYTLILFFSPLPSASSWV